MMGCIKRKFEKQWEAWFLSFCLRAVSTVYSNYILMVHSLMQVNNKEGKKTSAYLAAKTGLWKKKQHHL